MVYLTHPSRGTVAKKKKKNSRFYISTVWKKFISQPFSSWVRFFLFFFFNPRKLCQPSPLWHGLPMWLRFLRAGCFSLYSDENKVKKKIQTSHPPRMIVLTRLVSPDFPYNLPATKADKFISFSRVLSLSETQTTSPRILKSWTRL